MERNSSRNEPSSVFHSTNYNMHHVLGNEPPSIQRNEPMYPQSCTRTFSCTRTRSGENLAVLAAATPSGFTKLSNRTTGFTSSDFLPVCGTPVRYGPGKEQVAVSKSDSAQEDVMNQLRMAVKKSEAPNDCLIQDADAEEAVVEDVFTGDIV